MPLDETEIPVTDQEMEDYPGEDVPPLSPRLAPGQTLEEFGELYQEFSKSGY